ncbi:hypothetical protein VB711_24335 [Cronbergia sp. UHCC 0137]|uniref:hypothetical protein n=1 Tax=Cronbergia sp. UHCC 0137 TaxID=3110239 RepID=UPI002B1F26E9|nr:hypothetical protein [Cronbergia sp. UHCC 0137]MEA5620940.1 hypothetical protein [Cronbergia sp. UHCC 0137]
MNAQIEQLERERLLEVAEKYRQKGYQVILSPNYEELPDFLREYRYRPDMIVRGGEDAAVIEVKSHRSIMSSSAQLQTLAQVVKDHPGWRLELVITNPKEGLYYSKMEGSLQADEIKSKLQVARELTINNPESAILYVWSLAEATLRFVAIHENLILKKLESPLYLLKQLAFEGILSQTDYQLLMNVFPLRNAIAHGFKTTPITQNSVFEVIEVTEKLLQSIESTPLESSK